MLSMSPEAPTSPSASPGARGILHCLLVAEVSACAQTPLLADPATLRSMQQDIHGLRGVLASSV